MGKAGRTAVVVVGTGALALVGCSGSSNDHEAKSGAGRAATSTATAKGVTAVGGAPVRPAEARVVKNADLRVKVRRGRFSRAFDEAATIASSNGGFVASSTSASTDQRAAAGDLVLRVPAARFDGVRAELARLGTLEQQRLSGDDVTGQLVDLDARIRTLQAEEDALRLIVGRTRTVGEVLQVQPQLFDVRQRVEQLQAQRGQLDDAASFSTVRAHLFETGAPGRDQAGHRGLRRSVELAVDGTIAVVGAMVIGLGYLAPFLPLALVLVWAGLRLSRRVAAT